jgi:hypothetical protein
MLGSCETGVRRRAVTVVTAVVSVNNCPGAVEACPTASVPGIETPPKGLAEGGAAAPGLMSRPNSEPPNGSNRFEEPPAETDGEGMSSGCVGCGVGKSKGCCGWGVAPCCTKRKTLEAALSTSTG